MFHRWKNRTNFFSKFWVQPARLLFPPKIRVELAQPDIVKRAKIAWKCPPRFFSHVRVEPDQLKFHFLGFSHLYWQGRQKCLWLLLHPGLWLNSKKCETKCFFGNCPYGLWLAASGARRLQGVRLLRALGGPTTWTDHCRYYRWTIPFFWCPTWHWSSNLGYLYPRLIIDQNDSFRCFGLLMSSWRDSICDKTFETSHVRFIHKLFQRIDHYTAWLNSTNLLRKETCQTMAKPADIVLETWFEEYPTPPLWFTICSMKILFSFRKS